MWRSRCNVRSVILRKCINYVLKVRTHFLRLRRINTNSNCNIYRYIRVRQRSTVHREILKQQVYATPHRGEINIACDEAYSPYIRNTNSQILAFRMNRKWYPVLSWGANSGRSKRNATSWVMSRAKALPRIEQTVTQFRQVYLYPNRVRLWVILRCCSYRLLRYTRSWSNWSLDWRCNYVDYIHTRSIRALLMINTLKVESWLKFINIGTTFG